MQHFHFNCRVSSRVSMALRMKRIVRLALQSTADFRIQQWPMAGVIRRQTTSGSGSGTASKGRTRKWKNPFAWYNEMLDKHPVRTKCITSGVLYGIGDFIAQKATNNQNSAVDRKRLYRAIVFGTCLLAPLSHVHFNFLEWLVVEKVAVRAALVPFVKMLIDQFGYWAFTITAVYHVSMGAMEGLGYKETIARLKALYLPTLKAGWMIWPFVMIVNFKLIPVAYQLNFCLVFTLFWASIISIIRAPAAVEPTNTGIIEGRTSSSYAVES